MLPQALLHCMHGCHQVMCQQDSCLHQHTVGTPSHLVSCCAQHCRFTGLQACSDCDSMAEYVKDEGETCCLDGHKAWYCSHIIYTVSQQTMQQLEKVEAAAAYSAAQFCTWTDRYLLGCQIVLAQLCSSWQ